MSSKEVAEITFHEVQNAVAPIAVGEAAVAPAPTEEADLEHLIAAAQQKLDFMKQQNYVLENNKREQASIDGAVAAIAVIDSTIARLERQSAEMLESIESAVEQLVNGTPSVGQFGVPLQTNMHAQAAGTFAHLRLSLGQQRKSRALQMERLEILRRVQAQHSPKSAG